MDHRDVAAITRKWYKTFNEKQMSATVELPCEGDEDCSEEIEVPIKFEVCQTCNGKGSHVNPSIDSNGISSEEWDNDWSFEEQEMYMNGGYDVTCYECNGKRVVPEIDEDITSHSILARYYKYTDEIHQMAREEIHQREMGY